MNKTILKAAPLAEPTQAKKIRQALGAVVVTVCAAYMASAHATPVTLLENFDNASSLTGGFSFGTAIAGEVCCTYPVGFTIDPNFREQTATGFSLAQRSSLSGFELVLFQNRGLIDSFNVSLTSSHSGGFGPDLQNVIENWHFEDQLSSQRSLFSITSVTEITLEAGQTYWLALTAGRDVADGEVINIGWVSSSLESSPFSFARRNNVEGGDIDSVPWVGGSGGYTLRVLGNTVTPIPEPETYALMLAGLALVGAAARRRRVKQVCPH
jgi:hypothetical protein